MKPEQWKQKLAPLLQSPLGTQETQPLLPGIPLERALSGGELHTYRLALAAGDYLRLEVEQRGVDVVVTLSDREGRQVAASNLPYAGVEWVSLIAETGAELRLEIRTANQAAPAGRYTVKLAELRAATELDRRRVAADQALADGERLRAQDLATARRSAVGKYEEALALYRAAGDRRGETFALYTLGATQALLGERRKTLDYYKQSLPLAQSLGERLLESHLLQTLGSLSYALNQAPQALDYFQQVLPLLRALGERWREAQAFYSLGAVHAGLGDRLRSIEAQQQALSIWQSLGDREGEARARAEEALAKIEHLRRGYYQTELRAIGFTKARDFYELELDLLARLAATGPEQELIATALEISEQARARTMLDLLAEARTGPRTGLAPELQQREQANQARLAALQSQLIQVRQQARPDPTRSAALQQELKQAEEERTQLENELRRRHPRYAEMLYPAPLQAEAMRHLLDEETALLEYALGQESSFLFVVTREGLHYRRLPPAAEINRLVQEVRQTLEHPGRGEFANFTRAAGRLYELLLAPVANVLNGKSRLLIAPDGALYYLPFECLPAKIAGQSAADYLLKRWAISYVPSASVLASLRQNKRPAVDKAVDKTSEPGSAAPKQFVAFADPVYPAGEAGKPLAPARRSFFEQEGRWELARLAESRREVTEIARLYRPEQTALYLGTEAREENIKGNPALATARRLHFATHGLISASHPQQSALVLTLDDDPREDGLLQMWEIFNLKLQAELVVLSACRTGLGQELTGEGILGLARAFMYAGAPSVVVSLWNVADRWTAELMVRFYQRLDRAPDKAEALRQAKLELLRNPRYASPYYWAPFVLIGEPK